MDEDENNKKLDIFSKNYNDDVGYMYYSVEDENCRSDLMLINNRNN